MLTYTPVVPCSWQPVVPPRWQATVIPVQVVHVDALEVPLEAALIGEVAEVLHMLNARSAEAVIAERAAHPGRHRTGP